MALFLILATFLSVLFLFYLKFDKNITGFLVIGDYFKAPHNRGQLSTRNFEDQNSCLLFFVHKDNFDHRPNGDLPPLPFNFLQH